VKDDYYIKFQFKLV